MKEKNKKEENFRKPNEFEESQLNYIIEQIQEMKVEISDDIDNKDLTNLCTALAHTYGEFGRGFFNRLCENFYDITKDEIITLYSACLNSKWCRYSTIYSLFNIVKKYEIEVLVQLDSFTQPEIISNDVYEALPTILKKTSHLIDSKREKDIFFIASISVLSACFPMVKFTYRGTDNLANLFTFIIAPPGSGKSIVNFSKIFAEKIHKRKLNQTKEEMEIYRSLAKKENIELPKQKMLFIPANISAASIIQTLNENDSNGIIFESEADTLTGMFMQEWGISSDLLRKAYHHEQLSYRRKTNNEFVEILFPSLSILLCGTPDQIEKLINHTENGLLSRFLFYYFNDNFIFNNDFDEKYNKLREEIKIASTKILSLYLTFEKMKCPVEFLITEKQKEIHQETFSRLTEKMRDMMGTGFYGVIIRFALTVYKLSMIFTILKFIENKNKPEKILICEDKEFLMSIKLVEALLEHSIFVFSIISQKSKNKNYSQLKYKFFKQLPLIGFTRGNAEELALYMGINIKTAEKYLFDFLKDGKLEKLEHNLYHKKNLK